MISFLLHRKHQPECSIRIRVYFGAYEITEDGKKYKPFSANLPIKVRSRYWNSNKMRLKEDMSYHEAVQINSQLGRIESDLLRYISDARYDGRKINESDIRDTLFKSLGISKRPASKYFSEVILEMISDSEAGNRLSDSGDQIRPNTIKKYRVALRHLEAFEKRYSKVRIDDVNKDLAEKLQIYFNSINLAQNTKATQFNVYRTVINYAIDKKIIASTTFKEVTAPEILTDAIALSQEEVDKIAALHIDDELIRQHRDIFILGIYTMLRFSDYSHIDSVSIDKAEGIMSVITEKGQRPVVLPLHPSVLAILERYNDKLPQLKHVQIFNRSLKEIGRLAEIDKKTEIRTFKGGKVSKKIVERYSLISSHTARRTGATLLYLAGVPKKQIMLLTDHRKEANFDKYVRIDKLANAKMLSSHDFYADKQKKGL